MNKSKVKWYVINVLNFSSQPSWWYLRLDKASPSTLSFEYMLHNRWKVIERSGQKPSLLWLLRNYERDVRTCNQLRNPWQFLHSEHMARQPVILHVPFVTDASTSRLQHVWPYCAHTQHWIVHNALRLSKHDDGETSNKYQSSCRDYQLPFWVIGLWEGSVWVLCRVLTVTAPASFDPTNRSDLTQLFSVVSCWTAKSIWVEKGHFFSQFPTKPNRISKTCTAVLLYCWKNLFWRFPDKQRLVVIVVQIMTVLS